MSNKRKRDQDFPQTDQPHHDNIPAAPLTQGTNNMTDNNQRKVKVQEGYSWWNCMMYEIPVDKTKPHAEPKSPSDS